MNIDSVSAAAATSALRASPSAAAPAVELPSSAGGSTPAPAPAPVAPAASASPPGEELRKSLEAIRQWLPEPVRTDLKFRVEQGLNQVVVSVVDDKGKVLRQIPADVVIRVAHNLQRFMGGLVHEVA